MNSSDVLSLALAVAKVGGGALIINSDNDKDGWVRIPDAVESGYAFAVDPKPHIVPLDLDGSELFELGRKVKKWAEERLGARCVLTQSGREGHGHLWVVLPPDVSANEFHAELIANYDFPSGSIRRSQGTGRIMTTRPPLSPHRLGLPVALVEPQTVSEALEIFNSYESRNGLTPWYTRLLREGDFQGRYVMPDGTPARHKLAAAIAVGAIHGGLSRDSYVTLMLDPRNKGGEKYQEIEERHSRGLAARALEDTYDNVQRWIDANGVKPGFDTEKVVLQLSEFLDVAEWFPWPGRTGSSDRAILMGLIEISIRYTTIAPLASIRDLHLATGKAKTTVSNALKRLRDNGWIETKFKGSPEDGRASIYWLNLQKCNEIRTHSFCPPRNEYVLVNSRILQDHELFRSSKGLSGRPSEIYWKLERDWLSISDAAKVTGLPRHSVRAALKRLAGFGLAEVERGSGPKGGDLYRCLDVNREYLDQLAQELGVFVESEIRRERVKRERQGFVPRSGSLAA
ncbi:MarR family transcriptional regulator [Nonomuraea sp. NPDC048892]|uniref:MarR family transcriptional regulator n=1 Tax=Nonomuraea sp. NPDC048892 TaxID=3154624 RepID=UPI0034077F31